MVGAVPTSGIMCSAYKASRFGTLPVAYDTAMPGGAPDAVATSGTAFGGPGQVSLTVPTFEEYWVSISSGGHIGWVKSPSPVVPESDVTALIADLALLAPLASPTFTGTVTAAALTASGLSTAAGGLVVGHVGAAVSGLISAADGHLLLEGTAANQVIFNYSSGTGGVHFFNGAFSEVAGVDSSGKGTFNGGLAVVGSIALPAASVALAAITPTPATDSLTAHLAGAETLTGAKTFSATLTASGSLAHTGTTAGFQGTAPIARPSVTSSKGSNALASLMTALANYGLVTDSTSAIAATTLAAAIAPDLNVASYYTPPALTASQSVANPLNPVTGDTLGFKWTQDATGGRVITYGTAFKTGGAVAFATTLSTVTLDTFAYDGTNWRICSRITGQAI